MTLDPIVAAARLAHQGVAQPRFATAADVVAWLGAVQAQDYPASLWAIGLRMRAPALAAVEAAIDDGSVIRMHVFRGTWQCVARADARWMVTLVGARIRAGMARRQAQFDLDARVIGRCEDVLARALAGGKSLTRDELSAALARRKLDATGQRLQHLLAAAELDGVLCSGPNRDKQRTYALLSERAPAAGPSTRDEMLAELARRYFQSRAPATLDDFVWWSGLPVTAAREAAALSGADVAAPAGSRNAAGAPPARARTASAGRRVPRTAGGTTVHLLPAFDEYVIAYRDRGAQLDPAHASSVNAGGGMFRPIFVVDGTIAGTWQRTLTTRAVTVELRPFGALPRTALPALTAAAERYGAFLGRTARLTLAKPT